MTELGSLFAKQLADGMGAHHERVKHHDAAHRLAEKMATLEHLEGESVDAIRELLLPLFDDLGLDGPLKTLLDKALEPEHPVILAILLPILLAAGYALANAAAAGPVETLRMSSIRQYGSYAMSPDAVALAVIQGQMTAADGFDRAHDSGISPGKWSDLLTITPNAAPVGAVLEAYRRKRIDIDALWTNMARAGVSDKGRDIYGAQLWETLEPNTILELWRRKHIDDAAAYELMDLVGYNPTDTARVASLRWGPPPVGFAVAAATQNVVTLEQLAELLELNGIDPEWAEKMYETEGATMPPNMANRLFREGRIDLAQYEQILLESHLKNKYVPLMKLLRYRVPPMRVTLSAYHNKSITREEAAIRLDKLGFDVDDQRWMLDSAELVTSTAAHHLSMQQHVAAYEAQLESRQDVVAAMSAIGWATADIELELDVADHRSTIARQSRAANAIGTRYVSWHIDRAFASSALDALHLPTPARDEALAAWDLEREAHQAHPTLADLKAFYKADMITPAEVETELRLSGHDPTLVTRMMGTYFRPKA